MVPSASGAASSAVSGGRRGCCSRIQKYIVDPRRATHEYFLLGLVCLFLPGGYFYDSLLGTYKTQIMERMQINNSQFALLFAVSSITGVFCFPVTLLISRLGRTLFALTVGFGCAIGAVITTVGLRMNHLNVMLVGRFVFWLALNSLSMIQTILVYDEFGGKMLNFAMTLVVCSVRLGGSISYPLSGPLISAHGLLGALYIAVVLACCSSCAISMFGYLFRCTETGRQVRSNMETRKEDRKPPSLQMIRHMPCSMVFFLFGLGSAWGAVFPFEAIGDDMLQRDFGYDPNQAGYFIGICPLISVLSPIIAPFLGTSLRPKMLASAIGLVLLTLGFGIIGYVRAPIGGIVVVGVGYAVSICSFYSTIPLIIRSALPENQQGNVQNLVVGLNQACTGIFMMLSNQGMGYIKDTSSYQMCCAYLVGLTCFGICCVAISACLHRPFVERTVELPVTETNVRTGSTAVSQHSLGSERLIQEMVDAPHRASSRVTS